MVFILNMWSLGPDFMQIQMLWNGFSSLFFSVMEQIEQSSGMEGQCKLDSHDLNANGFLGLLVFDFGEKILQ